MNRGHRRTEKLTKPKAIVFDTDNTLYMYKPAHKIAMREVVLKVQKTLDIKEKEFLEAFNIAKNEISLIKSFCFLVRFNFGFVAFPMSTQLLVHLVLFF